jgi:hypothetical protein
MIPEEVSVDELKDYVLLMAEEALYLKFFVEGLQRVTKDYKDGTLTDEKFDGIVYHGSSLLDHGLTVTMAHTDDLANKLGVDLAGLAPDSYVVDIQDRTWGSRAEKTTVLVESVRDRLLGHFVEQVEESLRNEGNPS